MLDAYHQGHKRGYYAFEVWDLFKNPQEEKWFCCNDEKCMKEVTLIPESKRKLPQFEDPIRVIPHWRNLPNQGGCLHSGESDEHSKAKALVASLVDNESISLSFDKVRIPYANLEFKDVPRLPFRWEQTRGGRRADILFELKEFSTFFGKGIAFEIQLSKQSETEKKNRTSDWIKQGYSICWVNENMIKELSLEANTLDILVWKNKHYDEVCQEINEINLSLSELWHKIDDVKDLMTKSCRTCDFGAPKMLFNPQTSKYDVPAGDICSCWFYNRKGISKFPVDREPNQFCVNFVLKKPKNAR